jgi:ABC-type Fe3+/spermidine/putrescine transport system ATPase subunit
MLAGFELPTSGRIVIAGDDVTYAPPARRNIGFVFQNYALFPHLSVADNVAFGLKERKVARSEIAERVGRYLDLVHLGGFGHRKPGQLSGGQQQRVALARALAIHPTILLLDEPLGALDRKMREEMQIELRQLLKHLEITAVFVTHDQDEALSMSDRVAVMNAGRIEQVASPREIYEHPATAFCAGFLGLSNLFRVRVGSGAMELASGVVLPYAGPGAPGERISVIVRPEHVQLSADPVHDRPRGRVDAVKYLGPTTQYRITLSTGETVVAAESGGRRLELSEGAEVWVTVPAEAWRPLTEDPTADGPRAESQAAPAVA